jgi:hypothetical protein
VNFGVTTFQQGVLAFSRILNDAEVVVISNTNTDPAQTVSFDVIVDQTLNDAGVDFQVLYSNKSALTPPASVRATGPVVVQEVDGSMAMGRCTYCARRSSRWRCRSWDVDWFLAFNGTQTPQAAPKMAT